MKYRWAHYIFTVWSFKLFSCLQVNFWPICVIIFIKYRVAQKTGPSYLIGNILKTPWPYCVEIGELLQYYMLYTVNNFLFKNFIALWRHLAKTQLLCDAQIYCTVWINDSSCVFARWRHSAMKFLNKKLMTVQHIILQKFTNFDAIRSWSFQNICNEIGWPIGPVFCATLYIGYMYHYWISTKFCS